MFRERLQRKVSQEEPRILNKPPDVLAHDLFPLTRLRKKPGSHPASGAHPTSFCQVGWSQWFQSGCLRWARKAEPIHTALRLSLPSLQEQS